MDPRVSRVHAVAAATTLALCTPVWGSTLDGSLGTTPPEAGSLPRDAMLAVEHGRLATAGLMESFATLPSDLGPIPAIDAPRVSRVMAIPTPGSAALVALALLTAALRRPHHT